MGHPLGRREAGHGSAHARNRNDRRTRARHPEGNPPARQGVGSLYFELGVLRGVLLTPVLAALPAAGLFVPVPRVPTARAESVNVSCAAHDPIRTNSKSIYVFVTCDSSRPGVVRCD